VRKLIINADDFGLHPAVNNAVIEGHVSGCITSASLMPGGAAFAGAVDLTAKYPDLGVGVHLTLVGGEKPVSDPALVPSLVDEGGRFVNNYLQFFARFFTGKVSLSEVRLELTAQLDKVSDFGIVPTHVDSHQHLHALPQISDIVLDLAENHGIRALRIPDEALLFIGGYPCTPGRLMGRTALTLLAASVRRKAKRRRFAVPDFFFGMLAGGNMQEQYLLKIIEQLPQGISEIMVHPGSDDAALGEAYHWPLHWQCELSALTSAAVLDRLTALNINLVSFKELTNG